MTEQEFITGVADGTLLKVDIYKYCEDVSKMFGNEGLNDILDGSFAESLSYHTHQIVFVEGTDEIKDKGGVSVADQTKINRLLDAMGLIEARFGIDWGNTKPTDTPTAEKQPTETPTGKQPQLSNNEDTNKAIWGLLERLKADGWITPTDGGFEWQKGATNQLIAYWAERVSLNFNLSKREFDNGGKAICWKPFEALFGLKSGTLKTAKQSWKKVKLNFYPTRYEEIEPYTQTQAE